MENNNSLDHFGFDGTEVAKAPESTDMKFVDLSDKAEDTTVTLQEVATTGLAPDVIPAKVPLTTIKLSYIIELLDKGFNKDEIAVIIGHPKKKVDILFRNYKQLHHRKPKVINRLPFIVVDDLETEVETSN